MPCKKNIIERAQVFCREHKERLTPPRIEVLKILAASPKPLGAYDILKQLGKVLPSPKPPTAYRAIEFWKAKGFIHRIESLGTYMVCCADHPHQGSQFMICDDCGLVIETHLCKLPEPLETNLKNKTFMLSSWNVEVHGKCAQCQT